MSAVLVTGGAGFIGSHLVRALLDQGLQVWVLDNFSSGKRANLASLSGDLHILEGDLRDQGCLKKAVQDVEVVFHQAAFVSVPESLIDPQTCFEVNVAATISLFDADRAAGVRRVVMASSAAVYGDSQVLPLCETSPTSSLSPYAASKRTGEIYAQLYTQVCDLEVVALRYFNVYGPRQRPDSMYAAAVPVFIQNLLDGKPVTIYGDGGQTRDLIYIHDVVRANLLAAQNPQAPGKVLNICTGHETSIIDLLEVLLELFPDAPEAVFTQPRTGDIYRSVGSPEFASQILNFRAEVGLAQGLKETVEWMRA